MKLAEFNKTAAPKVAAPDNEVRDTSSGEEPQYTTSTTPSGIEVLYSWAPRRHYKLRELPHNAAEAVYAEWVEVPSVTTVLGVLDKSGPLTWWAQKVACQGVIDLAEWHHPAVLLRECSAERLVELLTEHKLTVNHVKDSAADRGVNVHGALEKWILETTIPDPAIWPESERGYVEGLASFLGAINSVVWNGEQRPLAELMVGSLEHQYAGRFDLVLTLSKPVEVVTRHYPKRKDKVEEIPAGRYLMDLKTRKKANVYQTNMLQLEAYEAAAVECGYAPTDYRAVIVVTEDGGYQVSVNQDWSFEDFLAVRKVYQVLNEREVLRVLRDELDAKEIVH